VKRLVDALRLGLQRVAKGDPCKYVPAMGFCKQTLKVDRRRYPAPET
jgi:hypothetical protein